MTMTKVRITIEYDAHPGFTAECQSMVMEQVLKGVRYEVAAMGLVANVTSINVEVATGAK